MDSISDSVFTMLQLQRALNDYEHPEWFNDQPPFLRPVVVAAATAMEHYGCQLWGNPAPDLPQVRQDLSGMFYFLLSQTMVRKGRRDEELYRAAKEIDAIYKNAQRADAHSKLMGFLEKMELLAAKAAMREDAVIWLAYFSAIKSVELDWEKLSRAYFSENVLKLFRKDYGEDTGKYKAIWGEKEDNIHLEEIIAGMESLDMTTIRHALVMRYSVLTGRRAEDQAAPPKQ